MDPSSGAPWAVRNLTISFCFIASLALQAVEAAQLAEDLKVQLEHTQAKLKEIQVSVAENRTARERESSNLKRAQVRDASASRHRMRLPWATWPTKRFKSVHIDNY